jgi:hypothetical protein
MHPFVSSGDTARPSGLTVTTWSTMTRPRKLHRLPISAAWQLWVASTGVKPGTAGEPSPVKVPGKCSRK